MRSGLTYVLTLYVFKSERVDKIKTEINVLNESQVTECKSH